MENILEQCSPIYSPFTLWFHNPNDVNWGLDSYHEILNFTTIEEFWKLHNCIPNTMVSNGMFFLMKQDIEPIWEDPNNMNGGCISFKVDKDSSYKKWEKFIVHLISGSLPENINGISISPKKNFNIIKLWVNNQVDSSNYPLSEEMVDVGETGLFRSHKNNIEKDKKKKY
jgi:translation initiation factor 4E